MYILKALFFSLVVPILFYIVGYDFDERGWVAFSYLLIHLVVLLVLYAFMTDKDFEKGQLTKEQLMNELKAQFIDEISIEIREKKCIGSVMNFLSSKSFSLRR